MSRVQPEPAPPPPTPAIPPDTRFHQANERTFLAWLRTGITLMGFGFVVARFALWTQLVGADEDRRAGAAAASSPDLIGPPGLLGPLGWIGLVFVLLGTTLIAVSAYRFRQVRRALLANQPIVPDETTGLVLAAVLTVLGLALALQLGWR